MKTKQPKINSQKKTLNPNFLYYSLSDINHYTLKQYSDCESLKSYFFRKLSDYPDRLGILQYEIENIKNMDEWPSNFKTAIQCGFKARNTNPHIYIYEIFDNDTLELYLTPKQFNGECELHRGFNFNKLSWEFKYDELLHHYFRGAAYAEYFGFLKEIEYRVRAGYSFDSIITAYYSTIIPPDSMEVKPTNLAYILLLYFQKSASGVGLTEATIRNFADKNKLSTTTLVKRWKEVKGEDYLPHLGNTRSIDEYMKWTKYCISEFERTNEDAALELAKIHLLLLKGKGQKSG